ncbi:unnamed protein product [Cunninghamella blakesleeana]
MITQQWQGKKKIELPYQSSTNKTILDHLLYLSIQSRLTQHIQHNNNNKQVVKNKVVDSIVTGILSSHLNNKKSKFSFSTKENNHFNRRLHLCQLTDMIFGSRYDISPFQLPITTTTTTSCIKKRKKKTSKHIYFQNALPTHCRCHRKLSCYHCTHYSKPPLIISDQSLHPVTTRNDYNNNNKSTIMNHHHSSSPILSTHPYHNSILIQVIPLFLKISADYFRYHLNDSSSLQQQQNNNKNVDPSSDTTITGLPAWYDLYLNLLTQATIEAYLCDGHIGIKTILDIFSYCYMDEDDDDDASESDISIQEENDEDEKERIDTNENDLLDDSSPFRLSWLLNVADYHLLFPKTRSSTQFKTQVCQREQEFLIAPEGLTLQDHFHQLAIKYPVETFDKDIREFIKTILKTMDIPILEKDRKKMLSTHNPYVFKNDDGSLLMPDIDDNNLNHFNIPAIAGHKITFKRRHSFDDIIFHKKQKQY